MAATLAFRTLAPNLAWFVIAQLAAGIADGWQDVSMNDDAVRVDARARQPIINRLHGVWSIGTVIGALAGTLLAVLEAPSAVFFLTGALIVTFLNLATFPLWRDGPLWHDGPLRHDEPHADHPVPETRVRVWTVRPLVLLAAMGIAVSVLEGSPLDWGRSTSPTRSRAAARESRPTATVDVHGRHGRVPARRRPPGASLRRSRRPPRRRRVGRRRTHASRSWSTIPPWSLAGWFVAGAGVATCYPALFVAAGRTPGLPPGAAIGAVASVARVGFLARSGGHRALADALGACAGALSARRSRPLFITIPWPTPRRPERT